jgi:hypothetical protein
MDCRVQSSCHVVLLFWCCVSGSFVSPQLSCTGGTWQCFRCFKVVRTAVLPLGCRHHHRMVISRWLWLLLINNCCHKNSRVSRRVTRGLLV